MKMLILHFFKLTSLLIHFPHVRYQIQTMNSEFGIGLHHNHPSGGATSVLIKYRQGCQNNHRQSHLDLVGSLMNRMYSMNEQVNIPH